MQEYFRKAAGMVHMKGKNDRIVSVIVPSVLSAVAIGWIVRLYPQSPFFSYQSIVTKVS